MSQSISLQPYATSDVAYKLPIGAADSKEYFLLTNRQQAGFDQALPGAGLLIEHCDDNKNSNTDETHYLVDIVQADGRQDLNKNANSGDATDVYPITGNSPYGDTVARSRIDARTVRSVNKKAGKVTATQTSVMAADGKTRTLTTTGVNAAGEKVHNVVVYEKQ